MRRCQNNRQRGFTLIELLVVIAIIAFIIGMLIPSLKQSMRFASSTVCAHNLKELSYGLQLYGSENKGWLPVNSPSAYGWHPRFDSGVWFTKLHPIYLPDSMVLSCPDDPFRYDFQREVKRRGARFPAASDYASYGINGFILNAGGGKLANIERYRPTRPLDTILLGDLGPDFEPPTLPAARASPNPLRNASQLSWDDGYDPFRPRTKKPWVTTRHVQGINMATIEGGVREARTVETAQTRITSYYRLCAAGGCTLCNEVRIPHYSFARSRLYWWTGPITIVE